MAPPKTVTVERPPRPVRDWAGEAEKTVRSYYSLLNQQRFEEAWARLPAGAKAQQASFDSWRSGYDLTEGTRPESVTATSADASSASVDVALATDDLDTCGDHVAQRFAGTWTLRRSGGQWQGVSTAIKKTSGGEPVRDPANCPDYQAVTVPPDYTPPDPGFDLNPDPSAGEPAYTPPLDFCDTHDCIPNYSNGTGYTVQCNDGMWSNSGGRQGACSWHGGTSP